MAEGESAHEEGRQCSWCDQPASSLNQDWIRVQVNGRVGKFGLLVGVICLQCRLCYRCIGNNVRDLTNINDRNLGCRNL